MSQREQVQQLLPGCYTEEFDRCLKDDWQSLPQCSRYGPLHAAYAADFEATEQLVDAVPYCSSTTALRNILLAGAAGLVVGAIAMIAVR